MDTAPLEGHCACGNVRYRLKAAPMFVHCCHCTWCQRETGTGFALNAMVESDAVELLQGAPERVAIPSASGKGQTILRCPSCRVALWSHYAGAGEGVSFIRVGTLTEPGRVPPDLHIFTSTKLPWVILPPDARVMPEFYDLRAVWPEASFARLRAARARAGAPPV